MAGQFGPLFPANAFIQDIADKVCKTIKKRRHSCFKLSLGEIYS